MNIRRATAATNAHNALNALVCVCDVGCIIESVPTIDWQLKLIIAES